MQTHTVTPKLSASFLRVQGMSVGSVSYKTLELLYFGLTTMVEYANFLCITISRVDVESLTYA